MGTKNIDVFLSGGASNTDPNLSLGGLPSTTKLLNQTTTYVGSGIAGVTLLDSANLSEAVLTYVDAANTLSVKEVGEVLPAVTVDVSVSGDYILPTPDGSAELVVSVNSASLPNANTSDTILTALIMNNLFDDVSAQESQVGAINYRHLYITNKTAGTISLKIVITSQLNGMDYLELGFESVVHGNIDQLLPDEGSAPVGVSFNAPSTEVDAILLTVATISTIGVFIKRTVLSLTDVSTSVDTSLISINEYL